MEVRDNVSACLLGLLGISCEATRPTLTHRKSSSHRGYWHFHERSSTDPRVACRGRHMPSQVLLIQNGLGKLRPRASHTGAPEQPSFARPRTRDPTTSRTLPSHLHNEHPRKETAELASRNERAVTEAVIPGPASRSAQCTLAIVVLQGGVVLRDRWLAALCVGTGGMG